MFPESRMNATAGDNLEERGARTEPGRHLLSKRGCGRSIAGVDLRYNAARSPTASAQVLKLVDKQDLGSCVLAACGFESHPGHQSGGGTTTAFIDFPRLSSEDHHAHDEADALPWREGQSGLAAPGRPS
jgi:hypothetical protein